MGEKHLLIYHSGGTHFADVLMKITALTLEICTRNGIFCAAPRMLQTFFFFFFTDNSFGTYFLIVTSSIFAFDCQRKKTNIIVGLAHREKINQDLNPQV